MGLLYNVPPLFYGGYTSGSAVRMLDNSRGWDGREVRLRESRTPSQSSAPEAGRSALAQKYCREEAPERDSCSSLFCIFHLITRRS